ncbi:MAG: LrgB family protein [Tissierellia bacterium]|nr:LrgB family protein [Tissierellia bacterium]
MNSSPYYGVMFTLIGYLLGMWLSKKYNQPLLNPIFVGIITCVVLMKVTGISYDEYKVGANYVTFFVAPATVSLIVPLYKNLETLKKNLIPVLVGVLAGAVTAIVSVILLANLFGVSEQLKLSLVSQSITTAIAIPLTEQIGGLGAIVSISIALRGISGAILAPTIFKIFNVKDPVAKGVAIGTTSHASGTAKAIEMGEIEGALSGLSIAIAGIITAIVLPIVMNIMG